MLATMFFEVNSFVNFVVIGNDDINKSKLVPDDFKNLMPLILGVQTNWVEGQTFFFEDKSSETTRRNINLLILLIYILVSSSN